ncbi:uncharacterized protein LOC129242499 [Anastrepha obliqua]|uniref:uncharacterized protein LOC129242499 n=1 Tax=Anastrepha obliqua TaxID=95512 RepID=UPI00240A8F8D|nr:uncharacterized protein LOC129242499 [Anastrepha obliqua]
MDGENDSVNKIKIGVHKKFAELHAALEMREKLLLRQLEVVESTKQRMVECGAENGFLTRPQSIEGNDIEILFENEDKLLGSIRSFGRFQLGSMLLALKQEDYITPNCDHEIMYKNIQSDDNHLDKLPQQIKVSDHVVVDFTKDKSIIEHNTKYINDSIVNITLEESKELIRKARTKNEAPIFPLNLEELDDELESSIVEAVSNLSRDSKHNLSDMKEKSPVKRTKLGRSTQKITINNCSGTINLQNISSVTINCGNDKCEHDGDMKTYINLGDSKNSTSNIGAIVPCMVDSVSEYSTPSSIDSISNQSSNSNSRSHSKKQKNCKSVAEGSTKLNKVTDQTLYNGSMVTTKEHTTVPNEKFSNLASKNERHDADHESKTLNCDFYNRLINEIKRNLDQHQSSHHTGRTQRASNLISSIQNTRQSNQDSALSETNLEKEPHLVMKNFENLNIVLRNSKKDETIRPVHVEHWLSEIKKDTNLEPMQNTDILEHSTINE